jgi:hypothetical protein
MGMSAFPICPPGAVPPNLAIQSSHAARDQEITSTSTGVTFASAEALEGCSLV